jgi:hypothetical protein
VRYIDPLGLDEYDSVLNLFLLLFNIDPETLGEDWKDYFTDESGELDIMGGLKNLLIDLGFNPVETKEGIQISVRYDEEEDPKTVTIAVDEERFKGTFDMAIAFDNGQIYMSLEKCNTVAEVATVILHEICHTFLKESERAEHQIIVPIQLKVQGQIMKRSENENAPSPYSISFRIRIRIMWLRDCVLPEFSNQGHRWPWV